MADMEAFGVFELELNRLEGKAEEILQKLKELQMFFEQDITSGLNTYSATFELFGRLDSEYGALCRKVREKIKELEMGEDVPEAGHLPLEQMKSLCGKIDNRNRVKEKTEEAVKSVRGILSKARHITTTNPRVIGEMASIEEKCRNVEQVLDKLTEDRRDLMLLINNMESHKHPVAALVFLVEKVEMSEEEGIEGLFENVRKGFGTVLASAARMGELRFEAKEPTAASGEEEGTGGEAEEIEDGEEEAKASTEPVGEEEKAEEEPIEEIAKEEKEKEKEGEEGALVEKEACERESRREMSSLTVARKDILQGLGSMEIAASLGDLESEEFKNGLLALSLALLSEKRFSEAYWLARCIEKEGAYTGFPLPPWLLRALALIPHFRGRSDELAQALGSCYADYSQDDLSWGGEEEETALAHLAFSATIKPTLMAPHTGASGLLRVLEGPPGPLHELRNKAVDCSDRGMVFYPDYLAVINHGADMAKQLEKIRETTEKWVKEASKKTLVYVKATNVWRHWLKKGNLVNELLKVVIEDDVSRLHWLEGRLAELSDPKNVQHEVDLALEEIKSGPRTSRIEARAKTQLDGHFREAMNLARRWLEFRSQALLAGKEDFINSLGSEWRTVRGLVNKAVDHLTGAVESQNIWIRAGRATCQAALSDLAKYLDEETPSISRPASSEELLRRTLLVMPDWSKGEPEIRQGVVLPPPVSSFVRNLGKAQVDPGRAFRIYLERGRLDLAGEILDQYEEDGSKVTAGMKKELEDRKIEIQEILAKGISRTRVLVEDATLKDALDENTRAEYMQELEKLDEVDTDNLELSRGRLESIKHGVEARKEELAANLRIRLDALKASDEDKALVEGALDAEDFVVANEYLVMLEKEGRILPGKEPVDDPLEFFKVFDGLFQEFGERKDNQVTARMLSSLQRRGNLAGIRMSRLTSAAAREAEELLRAWFDLKKSMDGSRTALLRRVLTGIGFSPEDMFKIRDIGKKQSLYSLKLEGVPRCPVHEFGSSARDRLFLLCLWDRPSEEVLLHLVEDYCREKPTIVLYFGRLSRAYRETAARMAVKESLHWLVIDDMALLYLCTIRGDRLSAFYRTALPISGRNPFTPDVAANVPPEIFMGRRKEKGSIIDPKGSGFIYGGRQFGKSALLKNVLNSYNEPSKGRAVVYIDLKVEGIGGDRDIDEIWTVIGGELKEYGIIPSSVSGIQKPETLLGYVEKWLDADHERMLVLLLDEADEFLRQDAATGSKKGTSEFAKVSALKGLRDKTEGRFKIVFAGLHGVQRFSYVPNQPLAHLGRPLSIGPLEPRAAMDLIVEPFRALGYEFEGQDVVMRILSHTNYQPLLIQIFCWRLFEFMTEQRLYGRSGFPPYVIKGDDVDTVYDNQDLRREIRERFELTLDLDPWYKLIAYIFAYRYMEGGQDFEGLKTADVKTEADFWWKRAMKGAPVDWISNLLEEMIGLGVLSKGTGGRFRLRSPNVIRLLGTSEDVHNVLLSFMDEPPEWKRDPGVYRRRLGGDLARRSPLMLFQESMLFREKNGVVFLAGSQVLGMDRIPESLGEVSTTDGDLSRIVNTLKVERPSQAIERAFLDLESAQKGVHLYLVECDTINYEEIKSLLERAASIPGKGRFVRTVFLLDPAALADWVQGVSQAQIAELEDMGLENISLVPWDEYMLRQWRSDLELAVGQDTLRRIQDVTNGWPVYLERLLEIQREEGEGMEEACKCLQHEMLGSEEAREALRENCGLGEMRPAMGLCIGAARDYGVPFEMEELRTLCEELSDEEFFALSYFLEKLALLDKTVEGLYRLPPVVAKIV